MLARLGAPRRLLRPAPKKNNAVRVCRPCGAGSQESDSSQTAKKDMLAALRARQEALEETLRQRLEELKSICIREAVRAEVAIGPAPLQLPPIPNLCFVLFFSQELTGKLPKEYPLDPGEEPPTVRRKIGTAFKLDEQKILPKGEVSARPGLSTDEADGGWTTTRSLPTSEAFATVQCCSCGSIYMGGTGFSAKGTNKSNGGAALARNETSRNVEAASVCLFSFFSRRW